MNNLLTLSFNINNKRYFDFDDTIKVNDAFKGGGSFFALIGVS